MKEHPILMDATSVRGLLDRTKTMTRRLVKAPRSKVLRYDLTRAWKDSLSGDEYLHAPFWHKDDGPPTDPDDETWQRICAPFTTGDLLYVKEAWQDFCPLWDGLWCGHGDKEGIARDHLVAYRADGKGIDHKDHKNRLPEKWRPSIYMPRWASRLTLRVTSVRVQRLNDITGRDALAEGVDNGSSNPTMGKRWENMQQMAFQARWESIHGAGSWGPHWVWCYGLEVVT